MFAMGHEFKNQISSHPTPYRGEVLSIMAAMLTRLESEDYEGHSVIPVSCRPSPSPRF